MFRRVVASDWVLEEEPRSAGSNTADKGSGGEGEIVPRPRVRLEFVNNHGAEWSWEFVTEAICLREVEEYVIERVANDEVFILIFVII